VGVYYSFTDSPGYGPSNFVRLRNYIALFTDPRVLHAYWFTFLIAAVATIGVNIVSLAIAVGLNGWIRFKNALRGIYFIPNVLAILVVGYIFNYLFSDSLPALAQELGIDSLSTSLPNTAIRARTRSSSSSSSSGFPSCSCTSVTPGGAQAACTAESCSAHERTVPVRIAVPFTVSTPMFAASSLTLRCIAGRRPRAASRRESARPGRC
jgi:hypothetical protein